MRRPGCLIPVAAIAVGVAAVWGYLRQDYRAAFAREAGTLVAVRDSTDLGRDPEGKLVTEVTLVGDTGMEVRVRTRSPGLQDGERRPAAILVGGFRTGRHAVDVPVESGDLVLAAVEYPYEGPRRGGTAWEWIRRVPALRHAAMETPAALLLAAQYLYTREDVDPDRVTIVGVSLGVPFAVAVAATDRRLAGAALLHGGGDVSTLFSSAYGDRMPAWLAGATGTAVEWMVAPLEPTRYVGSIAPRPVLMVNATGDAIVPTESVEALYAAAREPKRLVWLEGVHVGTNERSIVDDLMRVTLEWMASAGLR